MCSGSNQTKKGVFNKQYSSIYHLHWFYRKNPRPEAEHTAPGDNINQSSQKQNKRSTRLLDCNHYSKGSTFYNRIRVYGFQSWLKSHPCFLIGGDHWIRKGVIIWLHRKGGGLERHPTLYLICHAKCWPILEYLLAEYCYEESTPIL